MRGLEGYSKLQPYYGTGRKIVSDWLKCIALERLYLFQIGALPEIPHTK